MKIAIMAPETLPVPPIRGGAVETWIYEVARRLFYHEVFVSSIFSQKIGRSFRREHVYYRYHKKGLLAKLLLSTYKLPFKNTHSFLYYLPYSFWHAYQLKKDKPDIIHLHDRPQFVKIFRSLHPSAKIILHIHQLSAMEERNLWAPFLYDSIDAFVGPSSFLAGQIKELFPAIAKKVYSVPNGVDLGQFRPFWDNGPLRASVRKRLNVQGRRVFLYVGRLVENKGVDIVLEAFARLVAEKEGDEALLVICGGKGFSSTEVTPYMEKLFVSAKVLGDKVVFMGYVEHKKIYEYYTAADVLLIPSRVEEGFGMIAIEAMASGLPVIVSCQGALPEVVRDGIDGIVVPTCSVDGFYQAMKRYLDDPGIFAVMGREGRRRVEELFTWDKVTQSMKALYEKVCS